jgi:hypothetical protein
MSSHTFPLSADNKQKRLLFNSIRQSALFGYTLALRFEDVQLHTRSLSSLFSNQMREEALFVFLLTGDTKNVHHQCPVFFCMFIRQKFLSFELSYLWAIQCGSLQFYPSPQASFW